ncbi:D-glucuronyl C5-epimerase family protein [Solirubrobacter phytolaccae]|uniref:D-glucuronyl C5-epimerase family protein n=1 Tax=Solirubrobacter phytolaccae TaxID=1404360 RepID=A0A9X3NDA1_9ACTN|nr:D-glucuronyl C5-epimerase family protein [Solirubrobacter phytolaccae]MDA0183069.1 D-glucuronyl C5-epimerase family protein [Solirubrobacter phytolaccae]
MKWWRVLAVAALVLAGCGEEQRSEPVPTPARFDELDRLPPKTGGFDALVKRREAYEAARRAEIARMRRSKSVEGALRVARLTGRITVGAEGSMRAEWTNANAVLGRLSGVPHTELAYVVNAVRSLAAGHILTADRLRPTFLILRQNVRFWKDQPVPASGWRTTFGRDPTIFQYYPGRGLQLQPLASWGRANAIAGACLAALRTKTTRDTCRRAAVTRSLDRLASLGARRSGYLAWEYYFAYGTGSPPWVSGMTQATAAQALARGYRALGYTRWKRAAERSLGAFEQAPPSGVAVSGHYRLYSFSPGHQVLNGELQAVLGLRDTSALLHSDRARRLFRSGDRAARRSVAEYDTGAWSLYSQRGAESTLSYHALTAGFLGGLCDRTDARIYCRTFSRFERYEKEPTRIGLAPLKGTRWDRARTVRFSLSKVSSVKVRVWGKRGLSLSRDFAQLPRGSHSFAWKPEGRGRFRVRIEARGPSGPVGVETRVVRVTTPAAKKKKPKKQKKANKRQAAGERPDTG